jgi:tetratricopeptide (TPR) repeat protein
LRRAELHGPLNQNTLGAAYCRAGQFQEAIALLEKNTRLSSDTYLPFDLYFLAMSWHDLRDAAKARLYYDWAVRWTRTRKDIGSGERAQLQQLRAEAAATLGIDEPSSKDRNISP